MLFKMFLRLQIGSLMRRIHYPSKVIKKKIEWNISSNLESYYINYLWNDRSHACNLNIIWIITRKPLIKITLWGNIASFWNIELIGKMPLLSAVSAFHLLLLILPIPLWAPDMHKAIEEIIYFGESFRTTDIQAWATRMSESSSIWSLQKASRVRVLKGNCISQWSEIKNN